MRWALLVLLLLVGAGAGCDKDRGAAVPVGQAINPAMVVSERELLREHQAISFVFAYDETDGQGWPADPVEQRMVRIIQDSGIAVAFSDMVPGQQYVAVGVKDTDRIPAMRGNIEKAGLALGPKLRKAFGFEGRATTMP